MVMNIVLIILVSSHVDLAWVNMVKFTREEHLWLSIGGFLFPFFLLSILCLSHAFQLQPSRIIYHHPLFKRQLPPGSCHHSACLKQSLPCLTHTGGYHKSLFSLNDLAVHFFVPAWCLLSWSRHHTICFFGSGFRFMRTANVYRFFFSQILLINPQ